MCIAYVIYRQLNNIFVVWWIFGFHSLLVHNFLVLNLFRHKFTCCLCTDLLFYSILAENEADTLISKSDKNKDGFLSFDEILDNYQVFISPESEGYYIFRDEL